MSTTNCPECGRPVGAPEGESAAAHAIEHYGDVPRNLMSKEAKQKKAQLLKIAESENVNTVPTEGVGDDE